MTDDRRFIVKDKTAPLKTHRFSLEQLHSYPDVAMWIKHAFIEDDAWKNPRLTEDDPPASVLLEAVSHQPITMSESPDKKRKRDGDNDFISLKRRVARCSLDQLIVKVISTN